MDYISNKKRFYEKVCFSNYFLVSALFSAGNFIFYFNNGELRVADIKAY